MQFGIKLLQGGRDFRTTLEEACLAEALGVGGPEECIAYIRDLQAEFGITQLLARMHYPEIGPASARRSMELFARHVMPAFQR